MSYQLSAGVAFCVSVDANEIALLQDALARAPQIANTELRSFMTACTAHLQSEVVQRTPTSGHGNLRRSIISSVQDIAGGIGVEGIVGSTSIYCVPVELGSKPHMPPVAPLIDWVQQKFGLSGKSAISAGWAVAMSIRKHGTQPVKMFARALADNSTQINARFSQMVARVVAQMGGMQ